MIKPKPQNRDGEFLMNHTHDAAFLLIRRKGQVHGMFFENGKLMRVSADGEQENLKGMICIAKVIDVVKNIDAVFVRLPDKRKCFVPMGDIVPVCNLSGHAEVKQGDNLLLQITKDPAKGKEASGTTLVKIDGEYCVVTPGEGKILFSHKLDKRCREQLTDLEAEISKILPKTLNVILRTGVGQLQDKTVCLIECKKKIEEMCRLFERASTRTEYCVLQKPLRQYQELLLSLREIELLRILSEDDELYVELQQFVKSFVPEKEQMCMKYSDNMVSLSVLFGVEGKLSEAISSKVWLKSGGFLYIEPTQAMTVIDVNSGKYDRNLTQEDAFYEINLEAAVEIAHQIVLRNLSGIIIVDFINMKKKENIDNLMKNLSKLFQNDTNSARIVDITKLGLVEITRKKTGKTLYEQILM